jgi:hypothetical protein
MIDIRYILSGIVKAITTDAFPDTTDLSQFISVDISKATITKTKQGDIGIINAYVANGIPVDIACGVHPHREIWLLIPNSSLPYRDIENERFGSNQRIVPSKRSPGFAVLFDIDGLTCGYTADSEGSNITAIFCESS